MTGSASRPCELLAALCTSTPKRIAANIPSPLVSEFPIAEIEDISIAIDATYYLNRLLDDPISHESLLPALGGLTNIKKHILEDLNQFEKHGVVPFFIFDGQPLKGQDEVSVAKGLRANEKTEQAWYLYHNGKAPESVATFSINVGMCQ